MGRLGKFQLASVVLGESVFNVTGFSLVIGLCSGMDTLAPQVCCFPFVHWVLACYAPGAEFMCMLLQAYGAQEYGHMGVILQRATIICLLLSAIIIAGWTQMYRLLPLLGALRHCAMSMQAGWMPLHLALAVESDVGMQARMRAYQPRPRATSCCPPQRWCCCASRTPSAAT